MSTPVFDHLNYLALNAASVLAQQQQGGPLGPEFGKASPVGLFMLAAMGVAVLVTGWAFHRRYSRFHRRRKFAEAHGIDLFDEVTLDRAMAEAGQLDRRQRRWF